MDKYQFDTIMEQIDHELRDKNIIIPFRPLHALGKVSKQLNTEIIFPPQSDLLILDRYDKFTLGTHISNWYQTRYGDRLKVHHGPGSVVLLIRGDPWKMVLPLNYGKVRLNCDPDLEKSRNELGITIGPQLPNFNVLCCIEDFPAGLAKVLTNDERCKIIQFFMKAYHVLQEIENISNKPYVNEAIADLQIARASILEKPPHYGMSKWSSLQFIEKLLKSFLEIKSQPIPMHHNLQKIAQTAQTIGLILPNANLLASVQCIAGVRYGEVQVTLEEAISAHHASLDMGKHLVAQIKTV